MVTKFLILCLAACLRDYVAHGLGLPIEAKVYELLPFTPRWACEAVAVFFAVLVVETVWVLAERLVSKGRRGLAGK